MGLKQLEDVTYFRLNNEINRPVNGQIMLHKDKEALDAFFKENVVPNSMVFDSITDKIDYLIKQDYIETAFIKKYRPEFLEELYQFIKDQNFQFKSFMAAYKFYNQYALKTNDGEYYLESVKEDTVFHTFKVILSIVSFQGVLIVKLVCSHERLKLEVLFFNKLIKLF